MAKKNPHPTTQPKTKPKKPRRTSEELDLYLDMKSLQMKPSYRETKERMAAELVNWVDNDPKAYMMEQFHHKMGIHHDTFYEWCKKSPILGAAHDYAMNALGVKRELLAIERNLNISSTAVFPMPHYHKRWKELVQWRDDIKKKPEHIQQAPVTVVIEQAPNTAIVAPKKTPEEVAQKIRKQTERDVDGC